MKMKKILLFLLIFTLAFSMISCFNFGNTPDDNNQQGGADNGDTTQPDDNNNPEDDNNQEEGRPGSENADTVSEKIINVYLIAGQSNAVGYGMDTGNKIANSDRRFVKGFDNVLYYGSFERWNGQALDEKFQPVTLGMGVAQDRSGAEIGIASAIADNGEMNAIIKCAQGATHLYPDTNYEVSLNYGTWTSPTYIEKNNVNLSENPMIGYMYTRFENSVREGIEMLIAEGYTPVIKGVWWMQGEAEMFTTQMASAYRELFETLITDMRNMLSDATGYDCSETPFVCGLPKWNTNNSPAPAYQGMVRSAMETVAKKMTNVSCVDCMPLNQHDDWHFDAEGQKYLGEKFVEAVSEFEAEELFETDLSIDPEIKVLAASRGLGFKANLTSYNPSWENSYGFIVVPTASLKGITGDYISALDKAGVEYKNIPATVTVDKAGEYSDIYFTCEFTDIAYADLHTEYTAIAYLVDQYGSYLYSSRFLSDSIARLASEKLYEDGADIDAMQKIVNAGINYLKGAPEESSENDPGFEMSADEITLALSSSKTHKLQYTMSTEVDYFVRFSSENPDILTVDANGEIKTVGYGTTYVVIECAGRSAKAKVTVEHFSKDGVTFDGVIANGEYVGDVITASNGNIDVKFAAMIKNGNFYMGVEILHGEWSTKQNNWWDNDNLEFKLSDGISHTVVFYDGEPKYSNNISYGMSKTYEVSGNLVTVIEICVEGVSDAEHIKVGFNGVKFSWLGAIWHNDLNLAYVTESGIVREKPIDLGNGIILDGKYDEAVYTDNVKNNSITANANGADVEIIGTLVDGGVLLGVTVNHNVAVDIPLIEPADWFRYMNIEFHFGGSDTQFIAIAHNRNSLGNLFTYCNTVANGSGYTSSFEIYIPFEAIGAKNNVTSVDFTARGWFETGWCDLLNSSWAASHTVSADGITKITK